jgi:hypothetical protein
MLNGLMDDLEHFNTPVEVVTKVNSSLQDLSTADTQQGFLRPFREPINSRAINHGGELSVTLDEGSTKRGHGDDHMHVLFNARNVLVEHVHFVNSNLVLLAQLHTNLIDRLKIFFFVEARDITSVKDVVDIF